MSRRTKNPARHAARTARHELKRQAAAKRGVLEEAMAAYGEAVIAGWVALACDERGIDKQRVICEGCGLEQEYLNARNFPEQDIDVYPCQGVLDLGCGYEYCVTAEAWLDAA